MSIIVSSISLPFYENENGAIFEAFRKCGMPYKASIASIYRTSIDARHGKIKKVYSVLIDCDYREEWKNNSAIRQKNEGKEPIITGTKMQSNRPVVVGLGPAGLFAAYFLAKNGYKPLVVERGFAISQRDCDVEKFFKKGEFSEKSNLQFGEGGAGSYSDGKLTTRINDENCETVLDVLLKFGAPDEIKRLAKPHIGTDILKKVVYNIRQEIIRLGGQVLFETKLESVKINCGKLYSITVNGEEIAAQNLVLAIGHSARDTFFSLYESGVAMQPKAFSVGVRIEHLQKDINRALYGKDYEKYNLPPAEYALSHRKGDRAVYTFCMCPGGYVVPAQSEENTIVTNGMSYHARSGKNANSAVVVSVNPKDYDGIFGGIEFQRNIERLAFESTGAYKAPVQTVGEFLSKTTQKGSKVTPSYAIGTQKADIRKLFPGFVNNMLEEGFNIFGRKIKGFDCDGAIMTAPETRTSSPIRIVRGDDLQSLCSKGIIPCGEGAGYAGGIMSAAVDGIRAASQIMSEYKPF